MSIKSKNKRVKICLLVGTICIMVASLWAVLATPETALAKKPGGGGGDSITIYFNVLVGVDEDGSRICDGEELPNCDDIFMVCDSGIEGRIESIGGGINIDRMIVNRPSTFMDITSVIDNVVTVDWDNPQDADCFGSLWDGTGFVGGKGTLLIELPDRAVNEMTVACGFRAKDTKGKEVAYTIHTTGVLVPMDLDGVSYSGDEVDWAAVQDAVNDGTANLKDIPNFFVQVAGDTPWTLSKSGSPKFACTGGGTFESGFGIRINDPRDDMQNNTLLCP